MQIFIKDNYLHIHFSDGRTFTSYNCTNNDFEFIYEYCEDEEAIRDRFLEENITGKKLLERIEASEILTLRGNSVYMLDISQLSIPEDFVIKILDAEEEGNEEELMKYKNFWTLVSLNPDSRVRNNLFWFIRRWDMKITDAGLIVAYRNAVVKNGSSDRYSTTDIKNIINSYYQEKYINNNDPYTIYEFNNEIEKVPTEVSLGELYDDIVNRKDADGVPSYTDMHSHSTNIRLGQPVRMPREKCDGEQEHSCSAGLHVGAKGWLKENYFGDVGLMALVNPANVVAVPTIDNYGKMRTCEYFPVAIVDFDDCGDVIEPDYDMYNDVLYLKELKYEGTINNKDIDCYELSQTGITREEIYENILRSLEEE